MVTTPGESPAGFTPPWWLRSPHLQTLWPVLVRRRPRLALTRERLELADGDFLDLDWSPGERGPLVVVFHGLEGSSRSGYARGLLRAVHARGWRGVVMHFRGCSGAPNRLARSYHSGDTADIAYFLGHLRRRFPDAAIAAVGYSLGGNALLKYLGEVGANAVPCCAVAVSVPFDLDTCARTLERGTARLYQWWLLRRLLAKTRAKHRAGLLGPQFADVHRWRTFRRFDDRVTAPVHGFEGVDDYYRRSSSRQFLTGIAIPTLVVHARDDPLMTPAVLPGPAELSPQVRLEVSTGGGHVGFVHGAHPLAPRYWLEERIPAFIRLQLPGACSTRGPAG